MFVDPAIKRILLYGDSFVFGKVSGKNERLPADVRFTGVLQSTLGEDCEILEEGLRARTIEGENAFFKDRDGLAQFGPILGSHLPLNLIVIFLGTNDCNSKADKTPLQIAQSLKSYQSVVQEWCEFLAVPIPQLLVIAPPSIDDSHYDEGSRTIFGEEAAQKVDQLPSLYHQIAKEIGAHFFDASKVCEPAMGDGVHLDEENNKQLGQALAVKVQDILK